MLDRNYPSQQELLSRLVYNKDDGSLMWLPLPGDSKEIRRWNKSFAGKKAGGDRIGTRGNKSAVYVTFNRHPYLAHRLIWIMVNGVNPEGKFIDHINGNSYDNRWSNLRLSDSSSNQWNRRHSSTSTSMIKGVTYSNKMKKWKVYTRKNGLYIHGGYYATKAEASVVAAKESLKHHGKFSPYYRRDFEPNQQVRTERTMSVNSPTQIDA